MKRLCLVMAMFAMQQHAMDVIPTGGSTKTTLSQFSYKPQNAKTLRKKLTPLIQEKPFLEKLITFLDNRSFNSETELKQSIVTQYNEYCNQHNEIIERKND